MSIKELNVTATIGWFIEHIGVDAECYVATMEFEREASLDAAPLAIGDRIKSVNGEEVVDRAQLRAAISAAGADPKTEIAMVVVRIAQTTLSGGACQPWSGVFSTNDPAALQAMMGGDEHHEDHGAGGHRTSLIELDAPSDQSMAMRKSGESLRPKLRSVLALEAPDSPVIVLCDAEFNPMDEIRMLSDARKLKTPVVIDCGVKVRLLANDSTFTARFKAAMSAGQWFVLIRATKSIRLLELLASLFSEVRENAFQGVNPNARIIICCEPHPHFPDVLTKHPAKTLKVKCMAAANSSLLFESISNSTSARRIVHGSPFAAAKLAQRRVQLSCAVEVIEIEPRAVVMVESMLIPAQSIPFSAATSQLEVQGIFRALPDDKFYGINFAGSDPTRLAVCSSLGNVYFVDQRGASLISFHAHDAAVWDVSFSDQYDVVTGGEDGLAVFWTRQRDEDHDTLICKEVMNFENDVYAVRHTRSCDLVAFGGFLPHILIKNCNAGGASQKVELATSVQSIAALSQNNIVAAGADGKVFNIDAARGAVISSAQRHVKKCPCVATVDDMIFSGSFDGTVKLWDSRTDSATPVSIKCPAAVTGIAADGNFFACCVGEGLHVYDRRNMKEALGSQLAAWKGLSRGIVMNAENHFIGTASPDGAARFWTFDAAN